VWRNIVRKWVRNRK